MRKADGEHVAQIAETHERREDGGAGTLTKHVAEEESGDEGLGPGELATVDGGKVGDVGEDVEDRDASNRDRCGDGKRLARVLQLGDNIVGVLPAFVAVDDVEQGVGVCLRTTVAVAISLLELERIIEVVRVGHAAAAGEGSKSREDDEEENKDLENAEHVEQTDSPFGKRSMKHDGKGDTSNAETPSLPAIVTTPTGGVEHISAKSKRIAGREAQQEHLRCEDAGGQIPGALVDALEVVLLTTRPGDRQAELEEDAETAECEDAAHDPKDEADAHGTCRGKDTGRSREDWRFLLATLLDHVHLLSCIAHDCDREKGREGVTYYRYQSSC